VLEGLDLEDGRIDDLMDTPSDEALLVDMADLDDVVVDDALTTEDYDPSDFGPPRPYVNQQVTTTSSQRTARAALSNT
jgi:hypothetical protein